MAGVGVHKLLGKRGSPGWLLLCIIGCHYTCCHRLHPVKPVAAIVVPLDTVVQFDSDLFSIVYRSAVRLSAERVSISETPDVKATETLHQSCSFATFDLLIVSMGVLAWPVAVLVGVLLPSFCHGGVAGAALWTLLNGVCAWILQFAVLCTVLSKGCGMERLALCLAMHTAAHAFYAGALYLRRLSGLMAGFSATVYLLGMAAMGCSISVAGRTVVAEYDTTAFYSNHLGAVLMLDMLREPAWWVAQFF